MADDEENYVHGDVAALMLILTTAKNFPEHDSPHSTRKTLLKFHGLLTSEKPLDTLFN